MAEPAVKINPQDEAWFDKVMAGGSGGRAGDPNGAFSKFRKFRDRVLAVAAHKKNYIIRVGLVVTGAVTEKLVADYRRGYNYHSQMIKSLPAGWKVEKVNGKNHYVFTEPQVTK